LRQHKPAPVETGRVEALNHEGAGVVRAGKAVFVAGALPGESVSFIRRQRHRQHDEAELVAVLEVVPGRVTPRCAHFGTCGGCALQHLDGAAQLAMKEQQLRDNLARIARVEPRDWLPPLTGPTWHYRRRARLGARYVRARERSLVGFRERFSSRVAALGGCEVLAAPVDGLLAPLGELLTKLSIRERVPQIEVAIADSCAALVVRVLDPPTEADRQLLLEFERAHEVRIFLQPAGPGSVQALSDPAPTLEYGLPEWNVRLQFEPTDFIQVNEPLNRALVGRVIELLALDADAHVLDLYCGLGNFTLPIARCAATVVGIEGDAGLVARAQANAARNGIANAQFHGADLASEACVEASWARDRYSHVLLDPPRTGARAILPLLERIKPQRVIYVSCHPGSLARDLGILVHELGFELLAAGIADMFPQTSHVESLAVLSARR
jgi:23S rRNA (uracil1939-C5)-methyltransferase